MCRFIALGLPARHHAAAEHGLGGRAGFVLAPVTNSSMRGRFPEGDTVLWVTDGHCSCAIQPVEPSPEEPGEDVRQREKYRNLGWSESKIERAIAASRAAAQRAGDTALRAHFQRSLTALVKTTGCVRLLVHEFSGSIEDESLEAPERMVVPLEDFARGDGALALDTLIEIHVRPAGYEPPVICTPEELMDDDRA